MKKLKAVLAVVLVLALIFTFAACSNGGTSTVGSDSSQADASSKSSDTNNNKRSSDILPEFDKTGKIEETKLTDTFDVSITATELTYNNYEVSLSLKLENKSNAKRSVVAGSAGYGCNSVNGYMIHDGYLNCDLDPGASAEEKISFSYGELNVHGINKIADIGIGFDISDENFKSEKSDMVFVKTQNADSYNYNEDTYLKTMKGNSLQNAYGLTVNALSESSNYSEGNVSILSQTIVTNKDGKSSLMVEFENKSDQALYINLSNLKLNGTSVKDSFVGSDLIWSNKKSVISISLKEYLDGNESLNANNIKSAAFTVKAANLDNTPVTQGSTVTLDF
ncbi:hypothetical protein [Ruminococcus sp.]|uniref:hypothetical protein n=1 Tax=Ruminococcus sp. TaxID=41978 RepID=UPI003864C29F